jgi:hypothetical protein
VTVAPEHLQGSKVYIDTRPVREQCSVQESDLWQGSTVYTERADIGGALLCTRERQSRWHGSTYMGARLRLKCACGGAPFTVAREHVQGREHGLYWNTAGGGAILGTRERPFTGEHGFHRTGGHWGSTALYERAPVVVVAREHVQGSTAYTETRPVGDPCSKQESSFWQGSTVYTERRPCGSTAL